MNKGNEKQNIAEREGQGAQQIRRLAHKRVLTLYLLLYDVIAVNASYFLGLWLRFDLHFSQIPRGYLEACVRFMPVYTVAVVFVFAALRLYKSLWKFASFSELNRILTASVVTTIFHIVGITAVEGRMPTSYYIFGAIIQLILVTGVRFG